jgi:hypothetical protein
VDADHPHPYPIERRGQRYPHRTGADYQHWTWISLAGRLGG